MERRKLVFMARTAPGSGSRAVWSAYHFALNAHRAGLPAEVRLAADAVAVLRDRPEACPDIADDRSLHHYMAEGASSGLPVTA